MPEKVLEAQIIALEKNIERMSSLLAKEEVQYRAAISGKFLRAISPYKRGLMRLKTNVQGKTLTPAQVEWSWGNLIDIRKAVERVCNQCLDYIGGIAVRKWGLEENICDLAETLVSQSLNQGSNWVSVAIVGEDRLLDEVAQTTQIIRLRFPEWGIWSLPFTAYEFGRWIIGEKFIEGLSDFFTEEKERLGMLIKTAAVQELIDSGDLAVSDVKDGEIQNLAPDIDHLRHCSLAGEDVSDRLVQKLIQHEAYLKELFADAFSTYFLGPAYAYARVCLRLDPNTALQDYPSEPSLARRVHVIAQMLGKMSERASEVDPLSSNAYAPETKLLMDLWQNTIAMIHAGYIAELNFSRPYDRWAEIMYNKLEDTYFDVGFSIRHWEAAKALGEQLRTDDDMTSDVAAISLPIVLNAAWYSRMRYPERVDSIENRARKLMREISDRRTDSLPQPIGGKLGPQTQTVDGTTKVI